MFEFITLKDLHDACEHDVPATKLNDKVEAKQQERFIDVQKNSHGLMRVIDGKSYVKEMYSKNDVGAASCHVEYVDEFNMDVLKQIKININGIASQSNYERGTLIIPKNED